MKYHVVRAGDAQSLSDKVNLMIAEGWEPVGSHQVVVYHSQLRYAGMQHKDTQHDTDYTQTMILKTNQN